MCFRIQNLSHEKWNTHTILLIRDFSFLFGNILFDVCCECFEMFQQRQPEKKNKANVVGIDIHCNASCFLSATTEPNNNKNKFLLHTKAFKPQKVYVQVCELGHKTLFQDDYGKIRIGLKIAKKCPVRLTVGSG